MSELQATPSYKTLPVFDEEPTPQQIKTLGLRPLAFDGHGQMVTVGQDTALYLKNKRPGQPLFEEYFGIKELAQYGPTGLVYEVGANPNEAKQYFAGPMINRPAVGVKIVKPESMPGETKTATLHMQRSYGEHSYVLVRPEQGCFFTLAEWCLLSIPAIYLPALQVFSAAELAAAEEWTPGFIGPRLGL